MEPYKTEEYKGYTINIYTDEPHENPLEEWDFMATMSCQHRNYSLSTKDNKLTTADEIKAWVAQKDVISLPIYMYEHGGITISTTPYSCCFDSGQLGYIHVTRAKAREFLKKKKLMAKDVEEVYDRMRRQIKLIDNYITGDVFRFEILNNEGNEIDSCGGYYGTDFEKQLLPEVRKTIDNYIKKISLT